MTLKLNYTIFWKERRGARLDKVILCPLKVKYNKDLEIFKKKVKEKNENNSSLSYRRDKVSALVLSKVPA